jgi:hypothetical protein
MVVLHPNLWEAICAHGTVRELHVWRTISNNLEIAATRALQKRFPRLTLTHILEHTAKPLLQPAHSATFMQTCNHVVRGQGWELYYFIPMYTFLDARQNVLRLHLRLTREACCIFEVSCQKVRLNVIGPYLPMFICRQNRYDFVWWDFHDITRVAVQCVEINRDICKHVSSDMPYFLSPNGRAILIHHTVIHFNGTITPVNIPPHSIVRWSHTHLYANNHIIHTLDDTQL